MTRGSTRGTLCSPQATPARWSGVSGLGAGTQVRERGALTSPLPGVRGSGVPSLLVGPGARHLPLHTPPGCPLLQGTLTPGRAAWGQSIRHRGISVRAPAAARTESCRGSGAAVRCRGGLAGCTGGKKAGQDLVKSRRKADMAPTAAGGSRKVASRELRRRWGPGTVLEAKGTKCLQQVVPVSVWGVQKTQTWSFLRSCQQGTGGDRWGGDRRGQKGTGVPERSQSLETGN